MAGTDADLDPAVMSALWRHIRESAGSIAPEDSRDQIRAILEDLPAGVAEGLTETVLQNRPLLLLEASLDEHAGAAERISKGAREVEKALSANPVVTAMLNTELGRGREPEPDLLASVRSIAEAYETLCRLRSIPAEDLGYTRPGRRPKGIHTTMVLELWRILRDYQGMREAGRTCAAIFTALDLPKPPFDDEDRAGKRFYQDIRNFETQ